MTQPEHSSLLQPIAFSNTPSAISARAAPDIQRLRAFRHYVRLVDVGNWGANYLLFFQDQAETTRAKVVIVDNGFELRLHWLWRETGNASMSTSGTPSSLRRGHLA
ncbi:MAG TPA: hypothetical protein VKP30_17760, partial [Polyangiaceae bacterium]|nr:hypothetical protein [Polyangiaceae bacterium]